MCGARSSVRDTEQSGDEVQQPPGLTGAVKAIWQSMMCWSVALWPGMCPKAMSCSRARVCPDDVQYTRCCTLALQTWV